MILGFTGTRRGLTPAQRATLLSVIACLPVRAIHGGAVGADEEFNGLLVKAGMLCEDIEVWPASIDRWMFWDRAGNTVYPVNEPLIRNRIICRSCDALLACPATTREVLRSGTWATIRYARKARRQITIVFPDGNSTSEGVSS